MKRIRNNDIRKLITLSLGIILALFLVVEEIHRFQIQNQDQEISQSQTSAEDSDEDSDSLENFQTGREYISSNIQTSPDFESFEIMEILMGDEEDKPFEVSDIIDPGHFFRILFQKVISPNAP